MKAVILAGGEGSRLRPLTCDLPKPMVRLCGKPVMETILELLAAHGVKQASVTVRYLAEEIEKHFASGSFAGIDLEFIREDKPLGTAGGVRNAACNFTDDFFVISGDALCDYELSAAMAFHKKNKAMATIIVKQVEDPREYGLVDIGENGEVKGFIEKPGWPQAFTDTANTGIYILSRSCLDCIPQDKPSDFAKDIFPILLKRGGLYAFTGNGYWCDIGDFSSYLTSQFDMISGKVDTQLTGLQNDGVFYRGEVPNGDYTLKPPVYIGEGVKIGKGAVIGPNAVIDDGVVIGADAKIVDSVLLPDSYVSEQGQVSGGLLCRGVVMKRGSSLFEGAVAGFNSIIGENAKIGSGVAIWPEKNIASGLTVRENVKLGRGQGIEFNDDGIEGEAGADLTPEQCVRLGAALTGAVKAAPIGVATDGSNMAGALKAAFAAGVLGAGGEVYDFGEMFNAQLSYAIDYCSVGVGALFESDNNSAIQLIFAGGQSIPRNVERELGSRLQKGDYPHCTPVECHGVRRMSGMSGVYIERIKTLFASNLAGAHADFRCENTRVEKQARQVFSKLGGILDASLVIRLDSGARTASVYKGQELILSEERLQAACALINFESGIDIAVPRWAPRALERLASSYGCSVLRLSGSGPLSPWVNDSIIAAFTLLSRIKTAEGLSGFLPLLPEFAVIRRIMPITESPAGLMGKLLKESGSVRLEDGVELTDISGRMLVRPLRSGNGIKIIAEAYSMEAAEELCVVFEKQKNKDLYKM